MAVAPINHVYRYKQREGQTDRQTDRQTGTRGVVAPKRGGAPFRQIFLSRNGAPVNIVYHRRNAGTRSVPANRSGRSPVY